LRLRAFISVLLGGLALLPTRVAAEPPQIPDTPPPPAEAPVRHPDPLTLESPVTGSSYLTGADVDRFLAPFPLRGYGPVFVAQEARTHVRADFLVAIVFVENTLGKSGLAQEQRNLFSIKGSGAGGWEEYPSWEASIRRGADYIADNYVRPGQPFYRGGRIQDIAKVYAESPAWPQKVMDAANLIGPSRSTPYAAEVQIESAEAGQVRIRITNQGYMPWRLTPADHLLVHTFRSGDRRSDTAVVSVDAPDLRSGGSAGIDLDVATSIPDAWRLVVTVELAGADWLVGLGPRAHASWLAQPSPNVTYRPGISAGG
jgi:hypothetical protein